MPRTLRRPFIAIAAMILLITLAAPTAQAGGLEPLRFSWSALWGWLFTPGVLGYSSMRDAAAALPEFALLGYSVAVDPDGRAVAAEPAPPVPLVGLADSEDH